jgi:hypothetical protein
MPTVLGWVNSCHAAMPAILGWVDDGWPRGLPVAFNDSAMAIQITAVMNDAEVRTLVQSAVVRCFGSWRDLRKHEQSDEQKQPGYP